MHVPAFNSTSMVQALLSLQVVGHVLSGSHTSPGPITPSPQSTVQSLSFVALHPGTQQPSGAALSHARIAWFVQVTLQRSLVPVRVSIVHALWSSQLVGQWVLELSSQASVGPNKPSPQSSPPGGAQSVSWPCVASPTRAHLSAKQQPSPLAHVLIGMCVQIASHLLAEPLTRSIVQGLLSLQLAGVGQFPSHNSLPSTFPSPHMRALEG
jgi:hypothetical protein